MDALRSSAAGLDLLLNVPPPLAARSTARSSVLDHVEVEGPEPPREYARGPEP